MIKTFKPRKIIRLKERDYSRQGYYHVTIRIYNHLEIFGKIENNKMVLNQHGNIAYDCWNDLPNHIHGIINSHKTDQ